MFIQYIKLKKDPCPVSKYQKVQCKCHNLVYKGRNLVFSQTSRLALISTKQDIGCDR